jgi:hypothetical protein
VKSEVELQQAREVTKQAKPPARGLPSPRSRRCSSTGTGLAHTPSSISGLFSEACMQLAGLQQLLRGSFFAPHCRFCCFCSNAVSRSCPASYSRTACSLAICMTRVMTSDHPNSRPAAISIMHAWNRIILRICRTVSHRLGRLRTVDNRGNAVVDCATRTRMAPNKREYGDGGWETHQKEQLQSTRVDYNHGLSYDTVSVGREPLKPR